jgi:RNA polymerase sigma factor (sigma-70 family)
MITDPSPALPPGDADLARAAQRGDKKAFVEIVARHQAMVCGLALGILHDFPASEDAAQEAFLNAWLKIGDLREPEALRAWLAQIARNAAMGQLRRTRRVGPLEHPDDVADVSRTPDETAATSEEAALVEAELEKLPENYRLPLVLFYRQDQSVSAVAETLQLSEDAVKQRLSRGREMLRDRMSGVIESVLLRPRASAIFTITIAAAIGALMTPAAVAGSVFAATTAISTATATPIAAAAMTTSKLSLTTAALIAAACLPLGYAVHFSTQPVPGLAKDAMANARPAEQKPAPKFEDSALFAEWRKLHDTHGHDAAAMPALFKAIADIQDPFRRRAFRSALLAEWAMVDPLGGIMHFKQSTTDSGQWSGIFKEWFAREPQAAFAGLMQSGVDWKSVVNAMLPDIARQLPEQIPALVEQLPKANSFWDGAVREAFVILAEKDLASARAAAEALKGPNRERALTGIAKAWGKQDSAAALAWARTLTGDVDHDEVVRGVLIGLAATKPAAALDQLGIVPPGGREGYFATSTGARVLKEAADADFDGTIAWLAAHPGKLGHEDLTGLAEAVTKRINADPARFFSDRVADGSLASIMPAVGSALLNGSKGESRAIWDWVRTQPSGAAIDQMKEELVRGIGYSNRDLALEMAKDLPPGKQNDQLRYRIAQSILNVGNRLQLVDELLGKTDPSMQTAIIAASFGALRKDNLTNPAPWVQRLSRVPDEHRQSATMNLASAWASQDPQAAIGWARGLDPDIKDHTLRQVLTSWVQTDSMEASQWITTLPQGAERDAAAAGLVSGLAQDSPEEAWQWALHISDRTTRMNSAIQTVQQMNPDQAHQLIGNSNFTDDDKQSLMGVLRNSPSNK